MPPARNWRRATAVGLLMFGGVACAPTVAPPGGGTTTTSIAAPPSSGAVSSWGYDGFGNLGNDAAYVDEYLPVAFAAPAGVQFTAISAGAFHTLALADNGTAYAAGRDDYGELGNDAALAGQPTPVAVAAPAGVHFTAISAGGFHSLAIGDNGVTYSWGQDADGQLGDNGALADQATPVAVSTPAGVHFTAISAGYAHSLAIGSDGHAYSWGYDAFGELGNGTAGVNQALPAPVSLPAGVVVNAIAAGGHHNLALGDNGITYSWGWDAYGQLGDSAPFADQTTPVPVAAPAGVHFTQIATGDHHSLAIGDNGVTYSWGQDTHGQLGDDTTLANQPLPVTVATPAGVRFTQVAGGGFHSLAVGDDGMAYSWGYDDDGELGDNAAVLDHPTPTVAATPAGRPIIAVSAGYFHSLAIVT